MDEYFGHIGMTQNQLKTSIMIQKDACSQCQQVVQGYGKKNDSDRGKDTRNG